MAEIKTFLHALTKRAKDHDGREVTAIAPALRKQAAYQVNFRQKSQDQVDVKLPGSDAYAVFRFDGTWSCKGVITAGGQPTSAPPHDVAAPSYSDQPQASSTSRYTGTTRTLILRECAACPAAHASWSRSRSAG